MLCCFKGFISILGNFSDFSRCSEIDRIFLVEPVVVVSVVFFKGFYFDFGELSRLFSVRARKSSEFFFF